MTTPDLDALTPKRRKVYDLATKGTPPPVIARRLKITRSAVYSHMRHLRLAGLLPATNGRAAASTNGGGGVLLDDGLADQIARMVEECRSEGMKIDAERQECATAMDRLNEEAQAVDNRLGRYERALEALTA